ncbi:MAG: IS701 family transposase [Trueperaceae bacterium]
MKGLVKRGDYCQFLLVSQVNYTLTYFADHARGFSHDAATRYLGRDRVRPSEVWRHVKGELVLSANGYLIFDDSVLDKNHARDIEGVYRHYSGNEHRIIRGIGLISCVYVNPETEEFWVIDYRLYDPDVDGKDKHQHVSDMLDSCLWRCSQGELDVKTILMDRWYAITKLMVKIHRAGLHFYCPVKPNRAVSEIKESERYRYQKAEDLSWNEEELDMGKQVHLREFPQGLNLKLFRIALSTEGTEFIVTNDESLLDAQAVQQVQGVRWKVEQFHREVKQVTGIEACQCRNARSQRNHIGCALLVWLCLKRYAKQMFTTVYQLKQGLLDDYLRQQLQTPSLVLS